MLAEQSHQKELAALLTQITGQNIHEKHVTHRLLFLTALVTLLTGVMYADGQVTESEKQHFKLIVGDFIPPQSHIGQLIKPIFLGVQQEKSYTKPEIISKLVNGLTDSEKLLIIGLCHEVAMADGEIADKEEKYIKITSRILNIDVKYLPCLLDSSNGKGVDDEVISDIHNLLDPHHFQNLDPAFMRVADLLRAKLPSKAEIKESGLEQKISYIQLEKFQQFRIRLAEIASALFELVEQGVEQEILPEVLRDEAVQVSGKINSQRFRVAVVGEFSQGKSTVLNALLGEEIQPVRAIPCNGNITVLRYGEKQRVICRYKDGREEEVPPGKYQELASISQEAALSNIAEELSKSEIQEIVFEHPGLELCRHQVEIVDSPGLNEHPERTSITHQLLQNTDAVIFLANASRPFTQSEMELLKSIRQQLQGSGSDQPVENLFVLVNFMDLLRRDADREHVKQRANNFLHGESPIISRQNRLHFISAQAALDAMLEGRDDEYLQIFRKFTQAIQVFLTEERGSFVMRQMTERLERLVQETRVGLKQNLDLLEGQIRLSESEQSQIIEQIGAASGREVKLRLLRDDLVDEALEAIGEAWEEWLEGLEDRIAEKSADWTSEAEEKEKILQDFANQFSQDLSTDLDAWLEKMVKDQIILPKIRTFDKETANNLSTIHENLKSIDLKSGLNLSAQFDLSLSHFGIDKKLVAEFTPDSANEGNNLLGAIGIIGGVGLTIGILSLFGIGLIPIITYGGSLAGGLLRMFNKEPREIHQEIKQVVHKKGIDTFFDSIEKIEFKIEENLVEVFNSRIESAAQAIQYAIRILDEVLEKHDTLYKETVDFHRAKKTNILHQISNLELIERDMKDFVVNSNY
jgi:uncharacterized tellurite resistance protein B-like protein